jgi:hypothetical protein
VRGVRVSWVAWTLCLSCVALAAAGLVLGVLNGRTPAEIFVEEGIAMISALTVAFSVVGALVASHRPENPIGWIFCAAAVFQGLSIAGFEYAMYALITDPGSLPLGAEAAWIGQWIWAPGLGLILVFLPLLFPNGRPPSRRWRFVAWLGGLSIAIISIPGATVLWIERGVALLRPEGPADEGGSHILFLIVEYTGFPMMLVAGLAAVISLFVRFLRASGVERQQIKWFVSASVLTFGFVFLFEGRVNVEGGLLEAVYAVASLVIVPSIPAATGIAILRHRLYDIDVLINRALVYGSLTASLVLVYLGGVVCFQYVLRAVSGSSSQLAVVASTLAIAALFTPLRRRIQNFIDRRFYRSKYDAARTLEAFSARARNETSLDAMSEDLLSAVEETLHPSHASLWLRYDPEKTFETPRRIFP